MTMIDIDKIRKAFNAEDDRLANLPETEDYGNPFTVCTNGARWLQEKFFPEATVTGYNMDDNPTALIGADIYGHDFLIVGDYLIDFWYNDICGNKDAPVFLHLKNDAALVNKYYGDPDKWEPL